MENKKKKKQIKTQCYLARLGRAGRRDLMTRAPLLTPLSNKSVAVFGLGCIGAPSALEFARACVGDIRLVDHDTVDPCTIARWPVGLSASELLKVDVIKEIIDRDYPHTDVYPFPYRIGRVQFPDDNENSDLEILEEILDDVSLIYDATAEVGVQRYLSDFAYSNGIPYVGVSGTFGAWGGKVFRIIPGVTDGCWLCYRQACKIVKNGKCAKNEIPEPPSYEGPNKYVQPKGCADPTFTGEGFDMLSVAMTGVRTAVSVLCMDSEDGYPDMDWDITHISLRDDDGRLISPQYDTYNLSDFKKCSRCAKTVVSV